MITVHIDIFPNYGLKFDEFQIFHQVELPDHVILFIIDVIASLPLRDYLPLKPLLLPERLLYLAQEEPQVGKGKLTLSIWIILGPDIKQLLVILLFE